MSEGEYRFSPLAEEQLVSLWEYGYRRFGERQADRYLEGLFSAIEELAASRRYLGVAPRLVPPDKIADITRRRIRYVHYERHFLYLCELSDGAVGVVCILDDRMDTPRQLREKLSSSVSEFFSRE